MMMMTIEARRIADTRGTILRKRAYRRSIARSFTRSLRTILSTPRALFPIPCLSVVVRRAAVFSRTRRSALTRVGIGAKAGGCWV